ncbi:MAG: efflux RND transporter periplasmic adaptor subunit [Bacteroidota bacterium]|nr:efflux RND transporter periplasmic adaptor subunit [Bacteroidota bacterium]
MRTLLPIACFLAIFLVSCNSHQRNAKNGMVKDYPVMTLAPRTITVHSDFPATIQGQQVIEIRPMITGYIEKISVNEGDWVKKGQMLFKIKNPQYEEDVKTAKAGVMSAQADVNNARMEIEKVRPLVEKQIVSDYRLKSAELALESKEAILAQTKAALANAQTNLSYTIIKSPMDGIIGTIPYKTGALVASNSTEALTTLSDIRVIYAYFSWNEKQLLDFLSNATGESMEEKVKHLNNITLVLANSEEYPEKGKVELASGLISTETGSATLKAIFANEKGLIRSGSSATIRIPQVMNNVLIVPQGATYELQNKRFIYVLGPDNKVLAKSFTSIPSDDGKYFIVKDGLKAGDKIVVQGVVSIKDGDKIKPRDTSAVSFYGNIQ